MVPIPSEGRPKLIYFARRHPSIAAAGFPLRWREHGALGMSLPRWRNVWRYAQCDAVPVPGMPAAPYDGVATVVFRSEEARLAHVADPDGHVTRADEAATFAAPVRLTSVLTCAWEIASGSGTRFTIFLGLRRRSGATRDEFLEEWLGAAAARASALRRIDPSAGLIVNAAVETGPLALDSIDEIACSAPDGIAPIVRAVQDMAGRPATDDCLVVPTVERVLTELSG